jgi:hypothetical protein
MLDRPLTPQGLASFSVGFDISVEEESFGEAATQRKKASR